MFRIKKFLDLFLAYFVNLFFLPNKPNNSKFYLYLPYPSLGKSENILFKLSHDLVVASNSRFILTRSYLQLSLLLIRDPGAVICMHYSHYPFLSLLLHNRLPLSCYYTHNRFYSPRSTWLSSAFTIFFQSYSDLAASLTQNSKSNHVHLPVGIKESFLPTHDASISRRSIDLLFSLSYYPTKTHYATRKRYDLVIALSEYFSSRGFNVVILGTGWDCSRLKPNKFLSILSLDHAEYKDVCLDSKIFVMPSFLEGGPISFVEAYCSMCTIVSSPTGHVLDYTPDTRISLISHSHTFDTWQEVLENILSSYSSDHIPSLYSKRSQFFASFTFSSLVDSIIHYAK